MPLVYTSSSGSPDDQFEHPTVNGSRTCVLQDVSGGGTALPDGEYPGEPLAWDGAAWVPSNGIAVESIQAVDVTQSLTIAQMLNLQIVAQGDVFLRGRAPDDQASTLTMNSDGFNLDARAPGVLTLSQDATTRLLSDANGVIVNMGDAAFTVNAGGAAVDAGSGQTVGITVAALQRFLADDTSAQLIAGGSFVFASPAGMRVVAESGAQLNLEGPTVFADASTQVILQGPIVQIQDPTAASYIALSVSTVSINAGATASIAATSGAGASFAAGGVEIVAQTGQQINASVNGLQRLLADDTSAQLIAGGFLFLAPGQTRVVAESGGFASLESGSAVRVRANDTGLGFFGVAPVGVQSITGATEQDQIDSIVAALVALGLATDDR